MRQLDQWMFLLMSVVSVLFVLGVVLLVTAIVGRDPNVIAVVIGHRWGGRRRQVDHPPGQRRMRTAAIGVALMVEAVLVVALA